MDLLDQGRSLNEVALRLNCGASSVMRWRTQVRLYGEDGLNARPVTGRPPKLNSNQQELLRRLILHGAIQNGFETEGWTTTRIAGLIHKKFDITYHRDHIGRLMAALGFHYGRSKTTSGVGGWEEGLAKKPKPRRRPAKARVKPPGSSR